MHDAALLSGAIGSRVAFERVRPHVEPDDLTPQAALWWPLVVAWYARDPQATGVDQQLLREVGERELPPNHRATLLGWYDALPACPSPENAVQALLDIKRFNTKHEHIAALSAGDDGRAAETWERYASLVAASTLQTEREAFYDPRNAFAFTRGDNLIRLTPAILNERLGGGLGAGDTVVIYARPDMGKTALVVHIAVTAAAAGHPVLYVGNEEPIDRTVQRAVASITGQPTTVCAEHPQDALAGAMRRGLGNITFRDLDPGTPAQVESAVRQVHPRLVIVDQMRNIMSKGDSATVRMEDVQKAFRAMAKRHRFACISVTQAGDSASGKTFLQMGDVDNSNTGVQGACDVMIGVGATDQMVDTPRRGLAFPKNKLGHVHEGVIVSFDKARSRVE